MDVTEYALTDGADGPGSKLLAAWVTAVEDATRMALLNDNESARAALAHAHAVGDRLLGLVPVTRRVRAVQWMQLRLCEMTVLIGHTNVSMSIAAADQAGQVVGETHSQRP